MVAIDGAGDPALVEIMLDGDAMGDVIFSGSESRKPLGFAEVTLTLTGMEGRLSEKFGNYHEVAVTRRLHRSGESEYLINKVTCRLKDITELFMDTGVGRRAYSVVEQGRIEAFLSACNQVQCIGFFEFLRLHTDM